MFLTVFTAYLLSFLAFNLSHRIVFQKYNGLISTWLTAVENIVNFVS